MLKFLLLYISLVVNNSLTISPPGDIVGQLTVGYQGWFSAADDGSPRGIWFHWTNNNDVPSPGHVKFEIWPDMREYENTYRTDFAELENGQEARLFSSWDDQTIDTHFRWMSEYGIHTAALQRFGGGIGSPTEGAFITGVVNKAVAAAEKYGIKVFVMWDVSGWDSFQDGIKSDVGNDVQRWIQSPAYAIQNDKPVVCIWGLGFPDRPGEVEDSLDIINFLKDHGFYVIGGVPTRWRTLLDSKPDFNEVYATYDMISPWTPQRFKTPEEAHSYMLNLTADFEYLKERGIDYLPVVYPGFAWSNMFPDTEPNMCPRAGGNLMWRQFLNLKEIGIPSVYVAMFDEFDEGTAIAKAAETKNDAPLDQYFYTLDEDGLMLSSDFYLRLTHDGIRMLKGEIPFQTRIPTSKILH